MVRAWDVSSEARPSFQQIVVDLEAALQVTEEEDRQVLEVSAQAPAVRALVPGLVCEEGEGAAITVQLPTQEEGNWQTLGTDRLGGTV